jgi:hypothetical protein
MLNYNLTLFLLGLLMIINSPRNLVKCFFSCPLLYDGREFKYPYYSVAGWTSALALTV